MSGKNREQKQSNHRLRELIQATSDLDLAVRHGVPRSTARGWLKQAKTAGVCELLNRILSRK